MSKSLPAEILTKPSLAALSFVLRNPELWPDNFEWNYTTCGDCAIGLAVKMWHGPRATNFSFTFMEMFDISWADLSRIFCIAEQTLGIAKSAVTPTHIADLIDAHLAQKGE